MRSSTVGMASGNRAALITGSGRNMGRACAKELASMGFNVVVNGSRNKDDCERVADWGLTKALSREFGPLGVTANMISPGTFPGEDEDAKSSERYKDLLKQIPVGRLGLPEDIAAVVGLLCSDRGGFINGQLIAVNGGVVG